MNYPGEYLARVSCYLRLLSSVVYFHSMRMQICTNSTAMRLLREPLTYFIDRQFKFLLLSEDQRAFDVVTQAGSLHSYLDLYDKRNPKDYR